MLKRTSSLGATISDKPKEQQRRGSAPPTVDRPPTTRDFVHAEGGKAKMSKEFEAAYKHLNAVNAEGKMYRDITKNLDEIAKGVEQESESLKSFIDCRVHRVSVYHLTTLDEVIWAGTIAQAVKGAYKAELGDNYDGKKIEAEIRKHFMCKTLYSEEVPALLSKTLPAFVKKHLKVIDMAKSFHIFMTNNGATIAYDMKKFDEKSALVEANERCPVNLTMMYSPSQIEFTPFDPDKFMLAYVRVPIMANAVTLRLEPPAQNGAKIDVKIGKDPGAVGYLMSQEPAGTFRRSYNSQRVIEIVDWDDQGQMVSFQMKGAGVPEYGFDMANRGDNLGVFTGGEFFKLNAEKGAIGLLDFASTVFEQAQITPVMLGMALVMEAQNAYSGSTRIGAVSFRLDYSRGVRLSNVTTAGVNDNAERQRIKDMCTYMGVKDAGSSLWQATMATKIARNYAIANLFGMYYDDSSLKDLTDVGLAGEFSDSGSLRNLRKNTAPISGSTLASLGVKSKLPEERERFVGRYCEAVLSLLQALESKTADQNTKTTLSDFRSKIIKKFGGKYGEMEVFLNKCFIELGGEGTTPVQMAFYEGGTASYLTELTKAIQRWTGDDALKNPPARESALDIYEELQGVHLGSGLTGQPLKTRATELRSDASYADAVKAQEDALQPVAQDLLQKLKNDAVPPYNAFVNAYNATDQPVKLALLNMDVQTVQDARSRAKTAYDAIMKLTKAALNNELYVLKSSAVTVLSPLLTSLGKYETSVKRVAAVKVALGIQ